MGDFPGQIPYEDQWLHNKAALRNAEFLSGHIKDISNSGLSFACKKALINRALALFSNTTILSNLTQTKKVSGWFGMNVQMIGYNDDMVMDDFELLVLEDRAGYRRSDLSNPNLSRLENIQKLMLRLALTRTKGPNREGLEQHHMTTKSEQIISQSLKGQPPISYPQQQSDKKKFGIF